MSAQLRPAWVSGSAQLTSSWPPVPYIYYVIGLAAGWTDPTAVEIVAGQLSGGSAAIAAGYEISPTSTTSPFTFTLAASGLTPGTLYKVAYVWTDSTTYSNVTVSGAISTVSLMPVLSLVTYVPGSLSTSGFRPRVTATWS